MIAYNFHVGGNGAADRADDGRWELARPLSLQPTAAAAHPLSAHPAHGGESQLLAHLHRRLTPAFPTALVTTLYVFWKTAPFVVLTGREGVGKAPLVSAFAEALIGRDSGQFVTIASASWAAKSGERSYYRGLHERFGSLQFLDTLDEAGAPQNLGKLYLILFKGLTLPELQHYFQHVLQTAPDGAQYLALPGLPPEQCPRLPSNVLIATTLHMPRSASPGDRQVLQHVGQIELSADLINQALPLAGAALPPPVGLQRLMLNALGGDPLAARTRVVEILGRAEIARLGPSPALAQALWRAGVLFSRALRDEHSLAYVANSFDATGRGLFDPCNALRNARLAYDAQLAQRVLGRLGPQRGRLRRQIIEMVLGEEPAAAPPPAS